MTPEQLAGLLIAYAKRFDAAEAQVAKMRKLLRRIPIVRRADTPPFSVCIGCGRADGEPCLPDFQWGRCIAFDCEPAERDGHDEAISREDASVPPAKE